MNLGHGSEILALLSMEEESLARAVAALLPADLTVVRTPQEFGRRVADYQTVLIGDHQTRRDQIALVRNTRDANDLRVIAAIAQDPGMTIDLLEAGADAIVPLESPPEALAERILAARDGGMLLAPDETIAAVQRLRRLSRLCVEQGVEVDRCELLTHRERDIVALLSRRATNAQIAEQLGVAVGTVKNHVHNILDKLDVESRALAGVYWQVFSEQRGLKR